MVDKENFLKRAREFLRKKESTKNEYSIPLPIGTNIKRIEEVGPSHTGSFKGAIDFIVDLSTPIISPFDGRVIEVVDNNEKFGPTREFEHFLNYITISHENGEFSQVAHLAKGSALVKKGEVVSAGQTIGITGESGWMTEPHLHFFVFKTVDKMPGFKGLNIKFS